MCEARIPANPIERENITDSTNWALVHMHRYNINQFNRAFDIM